MANNKNQHYVPRCHLRPFSEAGGGKAINLLNYRSGIGVNKAPLRSQCAANYFYGADLEIEGFMQQIEGAYASVVRDTIVNPRNISEADLYFLRYFVYLQYSRTEQALVHRRFAFTAMHDITFRGAANPEPLGDVSNIAMIRDCLQMWAETREHISDLKSCIIVNDTDRDFVTSDDPAVVTNRFYLQRMNCNSFGLANSGVIMVMPLGPKHAVLVYDGDIYHIPTLAQNCLVVNRYADVLALNELQYLKCASNIYFRDWNDLGMIRQELNAVIGRKPESWITFWVGVLDDTNESGERYRRATEDEIEKPGNKMIAHSIIYPRPSRWLSGLKYRLYPKTFTDGSAVGFVREKAWVERGHSPADRVRITDVKRPNTVLREHRAAVWRKAPPGR